MSVIIDGTTGITTPTETIATSATIAGVNVVAVAPSTAGNVLTSTGSAWASSAPSGGQTRSQLFTASGTWTCPTGVTQVGAMVIGSGGGSARGGPCNENFTGGYGGLAFGYYTVVPGTGYAITIAAAGIGVLAGNGNTGGSVSFASFASATGGAGATITPSLGDGANGVGSSGNLRNASVSGSGAQFAGGSDNQTNVAVAFSTSSISGAGAGGIVTVANVVKAGVNGIVYLEWVG